MSVLSLPRKSAKWTVAGKIDNSSGGLAIGCNASKPDLCTVKREEMKTTKITIVAALAALAGMVHPATGRAATQIGKNMKAIELTEAAFRSDVFDYTKNDEWKFAGDQPAVIDFYATWCGPCKMMAPVMETLAGEYAGRVRIYKVDVDKEQQLAALFGVRSIPTFLFIPMEGKPQHASGAMGIDDMRKIIDKTLLGGADADGLKGE